MDSGLAAARAWCASRGDALALGAVEDDGMEGVIGEGEWDMHLRSPEEVEALTELHAMRGEAGTN